MIRTTFKVINLPVPPERVIGRVLLIVFLALGAAGAWMLTASDSFLSLLKGSKAIREELERAAP